MAVSVAIQRVAWPSVSMSLTCLIFKIKRDIGQNTWFFDTLLAFDAPIMWSPSDYCLPVLCGKTRMMSLPDGKKVWRFDRMYERDRQTHRHTHTAWRLRPRLMHASIVRQKTIRLSSPPLMVRGAVRTQNQIQLVYVDTSNPHWTCTTVLGSLCAISRWIQSSTRSEVHRHRWLHQTSHSN